MSLPNVPQVFRSEDLQRFEVYICSHYNYQLMEGESGQERKTPSGHLTRLE